MTKLSFLLSRTNTFSKFITREHSYSDSKVIDNLYKLEKVNNDNEFFLTVVNINENKFIKQAM